MMFMTSNQREQLEKDRGRLRKYNRGRREPEAVDVSGVKEEAAMLFVKQREQQCPDSVANRLAPGQSFSSHT